MKKLFLAVLLVTIFSIGCGNGNPVTPQKDLSGLVGVWLVTLIFTSDSYVDHTYTAYTITPITVIQESGSLLASQYNGTTLILTGTVVYYCYQHEGEECTVNLTMQILIQPGDQFVDINGTGTDSSGSDVIITGTMQAWNTEMV